MIQRFEDEYPETRLVSQPVPHPPAPDSSSQHSGEDGICATGPSGDLSGSIADNENAVEDEETDQYAIHLSRTSSMTSLHARAMTSEEGHVHRLGQNLRRDFLNPPEDASDEDDDSHLTALREKLERLHEQQSQSPFTKAETDYAFEKLGNTVDELWAARRQDAEGFEKFKQSQIAAQINSRRPSVTLPDRCNADETKDASPIGNRKSPS